MKVLFLVQGEQRANHDSLYQGVCEACDCDLRRLSSDQQDDLKTYFSNINVADYDRIIFFLRFKKEIRQARFIRTIPNLVILEHDACQNYLPGKYNGKFSEHYRKMPWVRVITSGYSVSQRLRREGFDAVFVPKGYDQDILKNIHSKRDVELGFIGSTESRVYSGRKLFLSRLSEVENLSIDRTGPDEDYRNHLNRILYFVSCDMGLEEYMAKTIEAMACGCIVLAFDQGEEENAAMGFRDMENIVLYDCLDTLREKLKVLRSDERLSESISKSGQSLAENSYKNTTIGLRVVNELEKALMPMDLPVHWFRRLFFLK